MKKRVVLLFILALLAINLAFSTTVTVEETEKVSLGVEASDPDAEKLTYAFGEPLDENGEWQTTYGDAGEYDVSVAVSDGKDSASETVKLIVKKKEEPPKIDAYSPAGDTAETEEDSAVEFAVEASDLNKDELSYKWELDGKEVSVQSSYTYEVKYGDAGTHSVLASVSDGVSSAENIWNVNVKKVDLSYLLGGLNNIEAEETGTVKLELPKDPNHQASYEISAQLDNNGKWKTTYDDAGEYDVEIKLKYGPNVDTKNIHIKVNNKDRLPEFKKIGFVKLDEGKKLEIKLDADDLDGGAISFSAEELPEGASFSGNTFTWEPGYDAVAHEGLYNKILGKFHIANKIFTVKFFAESEGAKAEQNARIILFDVNRNPVLAGLDDIELNEGEMASIWPEASDPDGDTIKYSYSGWMSASAYNTTYSDAGEHIVTVTASDGWLEDSKQIKIIVRDVNQPPFISKIPLTEADENVKAEVEVRVDDPDGDEASIGFEGAEGASMSEGKFVWTPSYDVVSTSEGEKEIKINFIAKDDRNASSSRQGVVKVHNVNRAPVIFNATPGYDFIAYKNQEIPMEIAAYDPDGDALMYNWDFGFFEKYENLTPSHLRTFTSLGLKTVKAVVSDGIEQTEHEWLVKVDS